MVEASPRPSANWRRAFPSSSAENQRRLWAFAHSSYAVFPIYIRGIELTIAGLIFGVAFLRLGLLTCIVAHFVVDAVLIGMPLLSSGNAAYVVSGVIVMGIALVPAALGLIASRREGRAEPAPG